MLFTLDRATFSFTAKHLYPYPVAVPVAIIIATPYKVWVAA
jgi:hypothetical protein